MKFKSDIEVQAGIKDYAGSSGTAGQVLSSDGATVTWIDADIGVASDVQNEVKAGVAINKGQAVYVTSADGTNIIVGLASNTSEATSSKTLGLLNATVAANGMADVVQIGRLSGLNTIGAVVGDPVWLGTNGNLIYGLANKPYAPAHLVYIGVVTRVNANNGEIFITVQNGFELDELHNVSARNPVNNDLLAYTGAPVNLWETKSLGTIIGGTSSQFVKGDGSLDSNLYVTLGTVQTITGQKTFSGDIIMNSSVILNQSSSGSLVPGYTTILGGAKGIQIYDGISSKSVSLKLTNITAARSFEFPDKSGTFALIDDVNGFVTLDTAQTITGEKTFSAIRTNVNGALALKSGASTRVLISSFGTNEVQFGVTPSSTTYNSKFIFPSSSVNYTFPTSSGTVALTSDLAGFVPTSRTITINGVSQDLSENRSWTVSGGVSGTGASGQVAFWNGTSSITGENDLFWDSTNNRLGIGPAATTAKLDIYNNIAFSLASLLTAADPRVAFRIKGRETATNTLAVSSNGLTDYILQVVNSDGTSSGNIQLNSYGGNVLIGTATDAGYKLDVIGTLKVETASTGYAAVIKNTTAGGDYLKMTGDLGNTAFEFGSGGTGADAFLNMYANNSQKVLINADGNSYFNGGNVGIGGTPAYGKLDLTNSSFGTQTLSFSTPDGTQNPRALIQYITASGSQRVNFTSSYSTASSIANWTFENGNVGIGTTNPVALLQVKGVSPVTPNTRYLKAQIGGGESWGLNSFEELGVGFGGIRSTYVGSNNWDMSFSTGTSTNWTNGTQAERMRITSGGNVGIGTNASPTAKLQINSGWGNTNITSNRMLQMDLGDVSDYQQHVILLHPIYDTTLINYNFCIGSIYSARGTSSAGRISDNYNVDTASAYNSTSGTVNSTGQYGKLYTCMYNGVKYIALMPFYRTSATGYTFDGYSSSTGEQLKIVVYRTSNTGVVNNSEVYNSLVEYASGPSLYQGDIQTAKSLYASGNIAIGTGTSTTKLTIDNSARSNTNHIDMVGYSSTAKGHIGTFTNALYLSSNYYYAGGQNADTTSLGQAAIILQAAATTGSYIDFNTGSAGATFPTNRMRIFSSGNVFIGSSPVDAGYKLDVNGTSRFVGNMTVTGTVTASGGFFQSSDIRLKEIVDYDYSVSDIKPISYLWKDSRDNKKHVGYSAQEVQKVMPDAVNEDADGILSVNYIEVLVAKIAELENRIKQLEK